MVIPKCIFEFDDEGAAAVRSIHPGVTEDDLRASTGVAVPWGADPPTTELPSVTELEILRSVVDPAGLLRAAA